MGILVFQFSADLVAGIFADDVGKGACISSCPLPQPGGMLSCFFLIDKDLYRLTS